VRQWADARADLGLDDEEFGRHTPAELIVLARAVGRRERRQAALITAPLLAKITNLFRGEDDKPAMPADFMPVEDD
jgi:hypothetical protein